MGYQMNNKLITKTIRHILALSVIFFSLTLSTGFANPLGGQIPQIPAFLPMSADVPMTEKLPIDGEWMVSSIRKRIRIEGGRAYASDPWVHMFVLKIEPLMVVLKDLRRTGTGQYTGQDLPLMGQLSATLASNGYLNVRVAGALGPANYTLVPVRMDDQRKFDREKSGQDSEPEEDYPEEEYVEDEDKYVEKDEYLEDEAYLDGEKYDEEVPSRVKAKKYKKAKRGCEGKQVYRSGTRCYKCPEGYKRYSPLRKMTDPQACTERGWGKDTTRAKYVWGANGCPKHQFKYKGFCMKCPEGTKRIHISGVDTGYCKAR